MVWSPQAMWGCRLPLPLSSRSLFMLVQGVPVIPLWQSVLPCSYPHATISALSLLSVVPEPWLPTACQQHTLCPCQLSPITPAAATCSGTLPTSPLLPSVLATFLQGEEGFFFFFLISGCCWTVTQRNSDIWEICHLSLRRRTSLIAAKIFNHQILSSVVFNVLRVFSFPGFLRTAALSKKKKKENLLLKLLL